MGVGSWGRGVGVVGGEGEWETKEVGEEVREEEE